VDAAVNDMFAGGKVWANSLTVATNVAVARIGDTAAPNRLPRVLAVNGLFHVKNTNSARRSTTTTWRAQT
jgi:hypothetical protein